MQYSFFLLSAVNLSVMTAPLSGKVPAVISNYLQKKALYLNNFEIQCFHASIISAHIVDFFNVLSQYLIQTFPKHSHSLAVCKTLRAFLYLVSAVIMCLKEFFRQFVQIIIKPQSHLECSFFITVQFLI